MGIVSRKRRRKRLMAEINVTPFVDVMLVLLIIFMVTSPMMTSGVNVDLPKTDARPVNTETKPITVSIKADGSLYLGDTPVTPDEPTTDKPVVDKPSTDAPESGDVVTENPEIPNTSAESDNKAPLYIVAFMLVSVIAVAMTLKKKKRKTNA